MILRTLNLLSTLTRLIFANSFRNPKNEKGGGFGKLFRFISPGRRYVYDLPKFILLPLCSIPLRLYAEPAAVVFRFFRRAGAPSKSARLITLFSSLSGSVQDLFSRQFTAGKTSPPPPPPASRNPPPNPKIPSSSGGNSGACWRLNPYDSSHCHYLLALVNLDVKIVRQYKIIKSSPAPVRSGDPLVLGTSPGTRDLV